MAYQERGCFFFFQKTAKFKLLCKWGLGRRRPTMSGLGAAATKHKSNELRFLQAIMQQPFKSACIFLNCKIPILHFSKDTFLGYGCRVSLVRLERCTNCVESWEDRSDLGHLHTHHAWNKMLGDLWPLKFEAVLFSFLTQYRNLCIEIAQNCNSSSFF